MNKEGGKFHKTFYCNQLYNWSDGEKVLDLFLISDVQYCSNDQGMKWLNVNLEDQTGIINAKVWNENIQMEYEGMKGHIACVSGKVGFYAGKPVFSIGQMKLAKESEIEVSEIIRLLPDEKADVCLAQIKNIIDDVSSEELKAFLESILNEEMLCEAGKLPVRAKGHHSYRGGLLAHMCDVMVSSIAYAESTCFFRENGIDMDIVVAGALLHDIGSLLSFRRNGYLFVINDDDRLLGKDYIIHKVLYEAKEKSGLDDKLFAQVMHVIQASHGDAAPSTMEAMIVRKMNQLSAEVEIYENTCMFADMDREGFVYSRELKREIWRK